MIAQHRQLPQRPGNDEACEQGNPNDADVVDEMVGDVEQIETSRRRKQHDRRNGRHTADNPGSSFTRDTRLFSESSDDDLEQADH